MAQITNVVGIEVRRRLQDISDIKRDSDESVQRSLEAKANADEAKHRSDITKKQLEQALLDGDQVYEVQTLRVNPITGEVFATAPDRFEADQIAAYKKMAETSEVVGVSVESFPRIPPEVNDVGRISRIMDQYPDGCVIKFAPKAYLTPGLRLRTGFTFKGHKFKTRLYTDSDLKPGRIDGVVGKSDIVVEDIVFDGANLTDRSFDIYNARNLTIKIKAIKGTQNGCFIRQAYDSYFEIHATDNRSSHFNHAGIAVNGNNLILANCVANLNDGNGFRVFGDNEFVGGRIIFSHCRANNNRQHGFLGNPVGFHNAPSQINFVNCQASENGDGVIYSGFALHYMSQITVESCIAFNNSEHGFVFQDGKHNIMKGCIARRNGRCGLRVQGDFVRPEDEFTGVDYTIITDNQFYGNGTQLHESYRDGISIEAKCRNLIISKNVIRENYGYPVRILTRENYTDPFNLFIDDNLINANVLGDEIRNFTSQKSIFGENWVNGVRLKAVENGSDVTLLSEQTIDISSVTNKITIPDGGQIFNINTNSRKTIDYIGVPIQKSRHIYLRFVQDSSNTITLKNLTGNLKLGSDFVADNSDLIELIYIGDYWHAVSRASL